MCRGNTQKTWRTLIQNHFQKNYKKTKFLGRNLKQMGGRLLNNTKYFVFKTN